MSFASVYPLHVAKAEKKGRPLEKILRKAEKLKPAAG
jgi:hypothetical protein